jgi:apolipoprotein D and lipocalin family protein
MKDWKKMALIPVLCLAAGTGASAFDSPSTVSFVDLNRYIGLWYEIARMPNSFQKQCVAGTTAEYSLMEDGRIQVINKCFKSDGSLDEAQGVARVKEKKSSAKLEVSFVRILGRNRFWGDYWIIGLDDNYQWAVIGHPKRKYGWILCRTPEMEPDVRLSINELLTKQGYDPKAFVNTPVFTLSTSIKRP